MNRIKTCIFDLDGVIVDTAKYHYIAWRQMANSLGFDFTEEQNEKLKGVSRMESLDLILQWGGVELPEEKKLELASLKNDKYLALVGKMTPEEILEGVEVFIKEVKNKGVRIALGSASKNARMILQSIRLMQLFDAVIDGNDIANGKPDPEVFLKAAAATAAKPSQCIVFEDAEKGIEAARRGGFWVVGIGNERVLGNAHLVIPSFVAWPFDRIVENLKTDVVS